MSGIAPEIAQRFARGAIAGSEIGPSTVRVTQRGRMRQKPGGRWMDFSAVEDLQVDQVSFSWRARFSILGVVRLDVVDEFATTGTGRLRGSLWGRIPVLSSTGPEVAEAQAQRYLSELFWCPHAILDNRDIEWAQVDDLVVRASFGSASVDLVFDELGDLVAARAAARYRQVGKEQVLTPWSGTARDFATLSGVRIPTRAEVGWDLPTGRFVYWEGVITQVELLPEAQGA